MHLQLQEGAADPLPRPAYKVPATRATQRYIRDLCWVGRQLFQAALELLLRIAGTGRSLRYWLRPAYPQKTTNRFVGEYPLLRKWPVSQEYEAAFARHEAGSTGTLWRGRSLEQG